MRRVELTWKEELLAVEASASAVTSTNSSRRLWASLRVLRFSRHEQVKKDVISYEKSRTDLEGRTAGCGGLSISRDQHQLLQAVVGQLEGFEILQAMM